jgi:flagellar motor protein MotB
MACLVIVDAEDVIREGISGERLTLKGQRESRPMNDNIYAERRPNNRREEFGNQ